MTLQECYIIIPFQIICKYVIMKLQEAKEKIQWKFTHYQLGCTNDVNLLRENTKKR
jgi:hypothetical protein